MVAQWIARLVGEEAAGIGGRGVSILLQDYGQKMLQPLPGRRLMAGEPQPLDGSMAGQALLRMTVVEERRGDRVRGGPPPPGRHDDGGGRGPDPPQIQYDVVPRAHAVPRPVSRRTGSPRTRN